MPAAPATEQRVVPGWIFSGEKHLSHGRLRSVPTSPAARDAQEFTEDRCAHGESAGLVCSSANLPEPVESIALAQDLSAAHLRGRAGETVGGPAPDLPFNWAGLLRDAPAAQGGNPAVTGKAMGEVRTAFQGSMTRGLTPALGQEQDQGGCRWGGRARAPALEKWLAWLDTGSPSAHHPGCSQ